MLVFYIYTISLMNIRICKAELDQMQKILEQPFFIPMKDLDEQSIQNDESSKQGEAYNQIITDEDYRTHEILMKMGIKN